jgi:hypothetical protein
VGAVVQLTSLHTAPIRTLDKEQEQKKGKLGGGGAEAPSYC